MSTKGDRAAGRVGTSQLLGGDRTSGKFDLFHTLDQEKQKRIINAALVEFAEKGFKRASTNAIVQRAGIGKGMLFYYFGSKEELFDFLCEYTIEFARNEYMGGFTGEAIKIGDFLERYRALSEKKRRAMRDSPEVIAFFGSFYLPENQAYFGKYTEGITEMRDWVAHDMYSNLDYSLFRDDLKPEAILRYIRLMLEGYELELTNNLKSGALDLDDAHAISEEYERFYVFLDDLRRIFYKEPTKGGGDQPNQIAKG